LFIENSKTSQNQNSGEGCLTKEAEKLVEEFSEDLAIILETFIEETQDAKVVVARIETEIGRLKDDITSLNKTIRDGNGQPPLITRIAVVEEKIAEIKSKIESMETETAEEKRLRWEFLLAAVPGILALLL
jgi:50S ribosomal subunit-associated GTPase HflX|tara:strand:+ start:28 stop:420 length:393 start_codon:yes stop_codon:yes gene_type:complete